MDADTNDPNLVAAALGGDRTALAEIYDRYADRVHDMCLHMLRDHDEAADVCAEVFLVAFARLGQLRDPQRLRSWLFAIARHEVYRRSRRRSRTQLVEEVEQMDRLMADRGSGSAEEFDTGMADAAAIVAVLRDAAAGLDERDRTVMELQLQGLDGEELAAALGTSVATGYQQVHRMKERLERSVGAVLVARQGRADCEDLDRLLRDWDGTFGVLWRKRVARHVDGCEVCERRRKAIPAALFGGAAAALPMVPVSALSAAPGSVRDRVLSETTVATTEGGRGWSEDGFPGPDRARRPVAALAAAAVLVLLLLGGALFAVVVEDPEEVAAGDTTASTTTASTTTTTTTSISTTSSSTTTTVAVTPAPVPQSTMPPTVPITTTPAPPTPAPPPPPPTTPPPTVTTSVEPGPAVQMTFVPRVLYRPTPGVASCGASVPLVAEAGTTATRVQIWWSDPSGPTGVVDLAETAEEWRGVVEMPAGVSGPVTLLAVASDADGRTGVSASVRVPVRNCPTPG